MSSALPRMPSGPGWFCARVRTMKSLWLAGLTLPLVINGSSACSGTKTALPLLTVWSTPWSKNWPKKVNKLLYGGERPTSVVTLGMNSVLNGGVQITAVGVATGTTGQGTAVDVGSCDRTGAPAAAT